MQKGVDFIGNCIVFYCHDGNGNVLMGKRSANCRDEQGCWDIGGGSIEFGDSIDFTLHKEIMQEYCTDVIDYKFLGYRDVHRLVNGKKSHWIALDFKVLIDKNKVRNGEPDKFDEIKWFKEGNWPNPVHSQFFEFLKNLEKAGYVLD